MRIWISLVALVAAAAVGAIVVVALGSDDGSDAAQPSAPTSSQSAPDPAEMEAFRDCMAEHGAELPEAPDGGVMIQPSAKTQKALRACQSLMPAPPGGGGPGFMPAPQN